MLRNSLDLLKKWYGQPRRKPLIIRGPRQVGKTTLIHIFAQQESLSLQTVNLEKHRALDGVFATLDLKLIIKELEACVGQSLSTPKTLLFLDEIQATPHALQALRYFYEERPELAVVAAGSLLEFAMGDIEFSMPVGRVEYLYLGPMTFREFLLAVGEDYLVQVLEGFHLGDKLPDTAHQKLLSRQREFMLVGGMPEAVLRFVESKSLHEVAGVQESIISTYYDDFHKYTSSKNDLVLLQNIFRYIPSHVGQKVKYANISREDRARDLKKNIQLLSMAGVISRVFHSDCSGLPLDAHGDQDTCKSLFIDIGLMNRVLGLDFTAINSLNERQLINEGGLAEQFVGQHLYDQEGGRTRPRLHYWLREGRQGNAEVDYVISVGDWIVPVEVKSGKSGSLRSLHQFVLEKKPPLSIRFDMNPPQLTGFSHPVKTKTGSQTIEYKMLSLPLPMVCETRRLIEDLRHK